MSARLIAPAIAFVALITVPYWVPGVYYINVASQILFYAIFALGLNVLVGYAGLVSLGHAGLFGISAYATGYMLHAGFGHLPAILMALVLGLVAMAVYAALSLRATGIGFIMITLAIGEILWGLAYRWISLTGGDNGISLHGRPAPFGFNVNTANGFYYMTLVVFLAAVATVAVFVRSPLGAALMASIVTSSIQPDGLPTESDDPPTGGMERPGRAERPGSAMGGLPPPWPLPTKAFWLRS